MEILMIIAILLGVAIWMGAANILLAIITNGKAAEETHVITGAAWMIPAMLGFLAII